MSVSGLILQILYQQSRNFLSNLIFQSLGATAHISNHHKYWATANILSLKNPISKGNFSLEMEKKRLLQYLSREIISILIWK